MGLGVVFVILLAFIIATGLAIIVTYIIEKPLGAHAK
jgi:peptidoglycan/LPS O-acetylase OafA/YrhL